MEAGNAALENESKINGAGLLNSDTYRARLNDVLKNDLLSDTALFYLRAFCVQAEIDSHFTDDHNAQQSGAVDGDQEGMSLAQYLDSEEHVGTQQCCPVDHSGSLSNARWRTPQLQHLLQTHVPLEQHTVHRGFDETKVDLLVESCK